MGLRGLAVVLVLVLLTSVSLAEPTLRLVTFDGQSITGAQIRVKTADGRVYEFTLDPRNPFTIRDVPMGVLEVEVVSWKGVPVDFKANVTVRQDTTLVVPGIGRLTLRVVGSRGQGLAGALVRISYNGATVEEGTTNSSGTYSTLLPSASYEVTVSYGGRSTTTDVAVGRASETKKEVALDVFAEIAGVTLSLPEFLGVLLFSALVVLALVVLAVEYSTWRRKRAAKVVAPPAA